MDAVGHSNPNWFLPTSCSSSFKLPRVETKIRESDGTDPQIRRHLAEGKGHDPLKDVEWVRQEIHMWIFRRSAQTRLWQGLTVCDCRHIKDQDQKYMGNNDPINDSSKKRPAKSIPSMSSFFIGLCFDISTFVSCSLPLADVVLSKRQRAGEVGQRPPQGAAGAAERVAAADGGGATFWAFCRRGKGKELGDWRKGW